MSAVMEKSPGGGVLKALAAAVGVLLVATLALALAPRIGLPPLSRLEVSGSLTHVRPDAVRAALAPHLNGTLLSLDLDAIRAAAAALPWVGQVRVERVWPGTVRVSVREHEVFAHWGQSALLSHEGIVFSQGDSAPPEGLQTLAGPVGQEAVVLETFRALTERLQDTDFMLAELRLSDRGDWTARTAQGLELRFGRGDPVRKLPLLLGAAAPALAGRLPEIAYLDLRYTNGFAVGAAGADAGQ
ncbi:MAG: FtsQ-type POTRA domain-containing protein [Gammaproteobacteria bacterium]|nr:FtsQ-type POTRA domain-containing protein [Gammaproteobacteria bacterium]